MAEVYRRTTAKRYAGTTPPPSRATPTLSAVSGSCTDAAEACRTCHRFGSFSVYPCGYADVARAFLDAKGVPYETASSDDVLDAEGVTATARRFAMLVECWK